MRDLTITCLDGRGGGMGMTTDQIQQILSDHKLWLRGEGAKRADLREADLRWANLRWADLREADLRWANLRWAELRGANLSEAVLRWAELDTTTCLPWQSHDLMAEILLRAAGDDVEKRKIAGLVLVSRDWCWERLLALGDPLAEWALSVLRPYVKEGDGAPDVLRRVEA